MNRYAFLCCIFLGFPCFGGDLSYADEGYYPKSADTYGGIGLIVLPTARFSDDGEFAFGISKEDPYRRIYSKVQFFPWLEVVLKYTESTFAPYYPSNPQTWKDKAIDLKVKLTNEGDFLPAMSVGLHDFGGTGAFSSEYLVASKRFNNLDLTLGVGWGRFAGGTGGSIPSTQISNPLSWLNEALASRAGPDAFAGQIILNRFFGGPDAAIFAGIEYYTPIPNLSAKLEYDTSNYSYETGQNPPHTNIETYMYRPGHIFRIDSRFNIALNYQYTISKQDKADFSVGMVRGNTLYANVAFHSNLNTSRKPKYIAPPEILNKPYLKPFPELDSEWQKYLTQLIMWQMGNEGFATQSVIFNGDELVAEISQARFQNPSRAIDLASRILGNNSPTNIKTLTVINIDQGLETLRATIPRDVLVQQVANGPLDEKYLIFNASTDLDLGEDAIITENDLIYPNFYWSISPNLNGTLQHQIQFYFWQLEALVHTFTSFSEHLYLTADYGIEIVSNFDKYTWHIADGSLPHVRQNRKHYLTQGRSGLRRMMFDYVFEVNSNISAKLTAGYLEWMYGGYGGEVLYMPDDKNWALGLDAYKVRQRDYDQRFGFQDFETVTGFFRFYYNVPFYNLRVAASFGKFLGTDVGMHLDVSRRFKTGATAGAAVSLTDCDPGCVGEGAFNKWVYFTLPLNAFSRSTTRGQAGFAWSPLTKDAGTQVEAGRLYNLMVDAPNEVDSLRRKNWSVQKIFSGFGLTAKKKI